MDTGNKIIIILLILIAIALAVFAALFVLNSSDFGTDVNEDITNNQTMITNETLLANDSSSLDSASSDIQNTGSSNAVSQRILIGLVQLDFAAFCKNQKRVKQYTGQNIVE